MQVASMHFKERAHASCTTRSSSTTCARSRASSSSKRTVALDRARRLRRHARRGARHPPARARRPRRLARDFRRERPRARRDGAVCADAGRNQRAGARDRAPARRAQDHQVEVDGLRGVGARPRDRGRRADGRRDRSRRVHPADQRLRAAVAHHRPGAAQVARTRSPSSSSKRTARREGRASTSCASRRAACCATHYLTADMGISGGNFFVAETGSVVARHQRRQRDADDHAAEGACRDLGHREDRARRSRTSRR